MTDTTQKKYAIIRTCSDEPTVNYQGDYASAKELADCLMRIAIEKEPHDIKLLMLKFYLEHMATTEDKVVEMIKISLIPWMNHLHPTITHTLVEKPIE